jgi:enoyl-CoA hydratase
MGTKIDAGLDLPTSNMIAEKEGGIGWMVFNNPERRNAISFEMRQAILMILDNFEADDAIRVVVLAGAGGKAFVSGSDISQFATRRATPEQREIYDALSAQVSARYDSFEKPMVAMIQGFCLGAGLGTAMQADLRIASDDSLFGVPAANLSLGYSYKNTKKLSDLIGPAATRDLMFTARRVPADEALRMGLISRVVSADALEETVRETAALIAGNAPLTIRSIKANVAEALKPEAERDIARCDALVDACMNSEDYKEGRIAFMEKRKPVFTGR